MAIIELKVNTNVSELREKIEQVKKLVEEINSFDLKVTLEPEKSSPEDQG